MSLQLFFFVLQFYSEAARKSGLLPARSQSELELKVTPAVRQQLWITTASEEQSKELLRVKEEIAKRLAEFSLQPWQIPGLGDDKVDRFQNVITMIYPELKSSAYNQVILRLYDEYFEEQQKVLTQMLQKYALQYAASQQPELLSGSALAVDQCLEVLHALVSHESKAANAAAVIALFGDENVDVAKILLENRLNSWRKFLLGFIDEFIASTIPGETLEHFARQMQRLPREFLQELAMQWLALSDKANDIAAFVVLLQKLDISFDTIVANKKSEFDRFYRQLNEVRKKAAEVKETQELQAVNLLTSETLMNYYQTLGFNLSGLNLTPREVAFAFEVERLKISHQLEILEGEQKKLRAEVRSGVGEQQGSSVVSEQKVVLS